MSIDVPNLFAGVILGVLGTLPFWLSDRKEARRATEAEWTRSARRIEMLLFTPGTHGEDLRLLLEEMPLDHWRRRLGAHDFNLLEAVEVAFSTHEYVAHHHARAAAAYYTSRGEKIPNGRIGDFALLRHVDQKRFARTPEAVALSAEIDRLQEDAAYRRMEDEAVRTNDKLNEAVVAFANMARRRSASEYTSVLKREARIAALRHPLREGREAWRRRRARRKRATPRRLAEWRRP